MPESFSDAVSDRIAWRGEFAQHTVYRPQKRPGFAAWATAFSYGDGTVGLSFDEVVEEENPEYTPPRLELAEAAGVPVSYCSVECGDPGKRSWRVYMRSRDGVHFAVTGRCPRREGSLCCAGFPDGRILGFDVPRGNESGAGWAHCICVRESTDGGRTWRDLRRLLDGCAPYLWRVRRLRNGEIVVLASLYGTPWGPGEARPTRNTMLPDESYIRKIQPFFLTTRDGCAFSEPHYILPGIGAHEFDFAELPDGRLLFVAGDVQGTPTGRQFVTPSPDGWIHGAMLTVRAGAPADPRENPQGGYVPETLVWDDRLAALVGYRRNKGYAVSNDHGENWRLLEPPAGYSHLYQPYLLKLPDGRLALYGHVGGDNAFGEVDMRIDVQALRPACRLPAVASLTMERMLSPDGAQYRNRFRARLLRDGAPFAGQEVTFRFRTYWNADGTVNTLPQSAAECQVRARTDAEGYACADAACFDGVADIHLAYHADVAYPGAHGVQPCEGPEMTVLALTPRRRTPFPYDAYFSGGTLYLSPDFLRAFPGACEALRAVAGGDGALAPGVLPPEGEERLLRAGALRRDARGALRWIESVHAPCPLRDVKPMTAADWYV